MLIPILCSVVCFTALVWGMWLRTPLYLRCARHIKWWEP